MALNYIPNYSDIIVKLIEDIKTKTNIRTLSEIGNTDRVGDSPTLSLALKGTSKIQANPSGMVMSQTIILNLKMKSVAATLANIAEIMEAEAKASLVFPMPIDIAATQSVTYQLADIENYNVSYFTLWNIPTTSMEAEKYERQWDLILNIRRAI